MLACIWMFTDEFDLNLVDDLYCCTLHFDTSLIDLDLDSRSQECDKANNSATII